LFHWNHEIILIDGACQGCGGRGGWQGLVACLAWQRCRCHPNSRSSRSSRKFQKVPEVPEDLWSSRKFQKFQKVPEVPEVPESSRKFQKVPESSRSSRRSVEFQKVPEVPESSRSSRSSRKFQKVPEISRKFQKFQEFQEFQKFQTAHDLAVRARPCCEGHAGGWTTPATRGRVVCWACSSEVRVLSEARVLSKVRPGALRGPGVLIGSRSSRSSRRPPPLTNRIQQAAGHTPRVQGLARRLDQNDSNAV